MGTISEPKSSVARARSPPRIATPTMPSSAPLACVRRDLPLNFFMERYTESFTEELRVFVRSVREGGPTAVTGADGRAAVVMAIAARKSYDEHRPVRIEEIGALLHV